MKGPGDFSSHLESNPSKIFDSESYLLKLPPLTVFSEFQIVLSPNTQTAYIVSCFLLLQLHPMPKSPSPLQNTKRKLKKGSLPIALKQPNVLMIWIFHCPKLATYPLCSFAWSYVDPLPLFWSHLQATNFILVYYSYTAHISVHS